MASGASHGGPEHPRARWLALGCALLAAACGPTEPPGAALQVRRSPLQGDTCGDPIRLPLGQPVLTAALDGGADLQCPVLGPGRLFGFVPPFDGGHGYRASLTWPGTDGGGPDLPAYLWRMGPTCAPGACDWAWTFSPKPLTFRAPLGTTEYFYLAGWGAADVELRVEAFTTPPNDTCDGPLPVALGVPLEASTSGAFSDVPCSGRDPDVVFSFTAPDAGRYRLGTTGAARLYDIPGACAPTCAPVWVQDAVRDLQAGEVAYFFTATPDPTVTVVVEQLPPPPPNNTCAGASPVGLGAPALGTTRHADGDGLCGFGGPDVVYRFTAPATGLYRATAAVDGGLPAAVFAQVEPCGVGACRGFWGHTEVAFRAVGGAPSFLVVSSPDPVDFALKVEAAQPLPGDTCLDPLPLSLGVPAAVAFSDAFDDAPTDQLCGQAGSAEVMFSFTPPSTGSYSFRPSAGAVYVVAGQCSGECAVADTGAPLTVRLVGGLHYLVMLEARGAAEATLLAVREGDFPSAWCPSGTPLQVGVPLAGSSQAADSYLCTAEPALLYTFTAPADGAYRVRTWTGGADPGGSSPAALPLSQRNPFCLGSSCTAPPPEAGLTLTVRAGEPHNVVVIPAYGTITDFHVVVEPLAPIAHDTCADPLPLLEGQPVTVPLGSAVDDYPSALVACGAAAAPDLVLAFTAPTTAAYRFTATPGAELRLLGPDAGCQGSCALQTASQPLPRLEAGSTSLLLVETRGSSPVTVQVQREPVPSNDACAAASALVLGVPVVATTALASPEACAKADVFYAFTPPADGVYRWDLGPAPDAGWTEAAPFLVGADCTPGWCDALAYEPRPTTFRGRAGAPQLLGVRGPRSMAGDFQAVVVPVSPPSNDTCAAPLEFGATVRASARLDEAVDDFQGEGGCGVKGMPDVVFALTAPVTGQYMVGGSRVVGFSQGTCGGSCSPVGGFGWTLNLQAGTTTYFIVDGYPGETADIGYFLFGAVDGGVLSLDGGAGALGDAGVNGAGGGAGQGGGGGSVAAGGGPAAGGGGPAAGGGGAEHGGLGCTAVDGAGVLLPLALLALGLRRRPRLPGRLRGPCR